jgi:hypothetical protein
VNYPKLAQKSVRRAFTILKSLAVDVTLSLKTNTTFSFDTGDTTSNITIISTKAIVVDTEKRSKDRNTITQQLILNTELVGELSLYDTLLLKGVTWTIGSPIATDGFVTLIDIYREA